MQEPAEPCAGGDDLEPERLATRLHPAAAHVLGERGHRQLLGDLRLADERARAAAADEVALAGELVQRGAHGQPRDAEIGAQLALRRDRLADAEVVDQVEDPVAGLGLLGRTSRPRRAGGSVAASGSSVLPLSGSKKWQSRRVEREVAAARRRGTLARGSTRALKRALDSCSSAASSRPLTSRRDRLGVDVEEDVRVGAKLLETTGTTREASSRRARANAAAPNASGRTPTTTLRRPAGGRRRRRAGPGSRRRRPRRRRPPLDEVHRRACR